MHKILATATLMAGLAGSAHAATLVNDGGLELWTGTTDLTQYVESSATVSQNSSDKTQGNYSANLQLGSAGSIRTGNFGESLQPDRTYQFSMDYKPTSTTGTEVYVVGARFWLFDQTNSLHNSWGPASYEILNAATTPGKFNAWNTLTFEFGQGTAQPITDGTIWGLVLVETWAGETFVGQVDNLQLSVVPEPSSMLFAGGAAILGLFGRRRERGR